MEADFQRSLRLVLVDEGGCDDDPHDHGGRTAHGIIQREYDAYRDRKGLPRQDVWRITPAEVTEIYHTRYWEPWCDQLPAGLDYVFFDFGVNAGPVQSCRTLQSVLGIRIDGRMGDVTLSAVESRDVVGVIHKFSAARRAFYQHLAQYPRYGRGWMARTNHCEQAALQIAATGDAHRTPLDADTKSAASARANADDTKRPPASPEVAGAGAATAGVFGTIVDKLHQIGDQLSPFQGTLRFIEYACAGIAILSAGFMIYGMVQRAKVDEAVA